MDDIFAESNTTSVWANRNAKLGRHQKHRQNFADTGQATRVYLTYINGLGLQKLLEDHAVMCMLSSCNTNTIWLESFANCGVSQDVIRSGGLFDKPRFDLFKLFDVFDGLWNVPYL